METLTHDPQAVLDYAWSWVGWLQDGETITAQTITITPPGSLILDPDSPAVSQAGGIVTAWLSGGTLNQNYRATCHITTSAGRQDDRSHPIFVSDR